MKQSNEIVIARDFSRLPAGRFRSDGPFNATTFREQLLIPKLLIAIESKTPLDVIFDGVLGYSSSFLEEAFGGVARNTTLSHEQVVSHLRLIARGSAYETARRVAESNLNDAFRLRDRSP